MAPSVESPAKYAAASITMYRCFDVSSLRNPTLGTLSYALQLKMIPAPREAGDNPRDGVRAVSHWHEMS